MTKPNGSTNLITDEERQAIKRLQQMQEEAIRRPNTVETTTKATVQKPSVQPTNDNFHESIPSTDELSALFEKRYEIYSIK